MKKGQPIRAGTGIGAAPKVYSDDLRARLKRRYLTLVALGYYDRHGVMSKLTSEFDLTYGTVHYLLTAEGLR